MVGEPANTCRAESSLFPLKDHPLDDCASSPADRWTCLQHPEVETIRAPPRWLDEKVTVVVVHGGRRTIFLAALFTGPWVSMADGRGARSAAVQ